MPFLRVGCFDNTRPQDCEEIVERDTDKLVRISKHSDEWTLRRIDRGGACQLGWEVGLAVASGTHYRLGKESPLSMLGDTDLLIEVLKLVPLVVPDHCETLKQAVEVAFPGQHILIRKGEFNVAANPGEEAVTEGGRGIGHTVLDVHKSVHLHGERGTVLRGMLVFKESAVQGSVRNLTVQDAGQCCILCETGTWCIEECFLMCGHASAFKAVRALPLFPTHQLSPSLRPRLHALVSAACVHKLTHTHIHTNTHKRTQGVCKSLSSTNVDLTELN